MKPKTLLFPILITLFFSCGAGNNSEGTEEVIEDEVEQHSPTLPNQTFDLEANKLGKTNDLLIESLEELSAQREIKLKGDVFFSEGNFKIINFIEYHENYEYPFVLIINPVNKIGDLIKNGDGAYSDISNFLLKKVQERYAVLPGNFIGKTVESSDGSYNRGPRFFIPIVLQKIRHINTSISGAESVWALSDKNKLTPLNIIAETDAEVGMCKGPIGHLSSIEINDNFNVIAINLVLGEIVVFDDCSTYTVQKTQQKYFWDLNNLDFKKLPDMEILTSKLAEGEQIPYELNLTFVYALNLQEFIDLGPWEDNPHYSWAFTVHKPGLDITTVCATYYDYNDDDVNESRTILFAWDSITRTFNPQVPLVSKKRVFDYLYSKQYDEIESNSIIVYPSSTYKVDFTKLQNQRISDASNVELKNDSIYILSASKTLAYPNKILPEGGASYSFVRQLDKNRVLLAQLEYLEGGMSIGHIIINTSSGNQIKIPAINGNLHTLQFSPDKQQLALTYDEGGYDGNYSPLGGVIVYDVSNRKLKTVYEQNTGYSGAAKLKWHGNNILVYHNYCLNFFILGSFTELYGEPELKFELIVGDYGVSLYSENEDIGYADYGITAYYIPTKEETDSYPLMGISDNDYFTYIFRKSSKGEIIVLEERASNENGQAITKQKEVGKLMINGEGKFIELK